MKFQQDYPCIDLPYSHNIFQERYKIKAEVADWLEENVGKRNGHSMTTFLYKEHGMWIFVGSPTTSDNGAIYFRKEDHAMLFKLVWQ